MTSIHSLSATQLLAAYANKSLSPVEVTLTYDGGTEMRVARWLSGVTAALLGIASLLLR